MQLNNIDDRTAKILQALLTDPDAVARAKDAANYTVATAETLTAALRGVSPQAKTRPLTPDELPQEEMQAIQSAKRGTVRRFSRASGRSATAQSGAERAEYLEARAVARIAYERGIPYEKAQQLVAAACSK